MLWEGLLLRASKRVSKLQVLHPFCDLLGQLLSARIGRPVDHHLRLLLLLLFHFVIGSSCIGGPVLRMTVDALHVIIVNQQLVVEVVLVVAKLLIILSLLLLLMHELQLVHLLSS